MKRNSPSSVEEKYARLRESIEKRKNEALKSELERILQPVFGETDPEPIDALLASMASLKSDHDLFGSLRARLGHVALRPEIPPERDPLAFMDHTGRERSYFGRFDVQHVILTFLGVKPCSDLVVAPRDMEREVEGVRGFLHRLAALNPAFGFHEHRTKWGNFVGFEVANEMPLYDVKRVVHRHDARYTGTLLQMMEKARGSLDTADNTVYGILLGFGEKNPLAYAKREEGEVTDYTIFKQMLASLKEPPSFSEPHLFIPAMTLFHPNDEQLIAIGKACKQVLVALDPKIALHAGLENQTNLRTNRRLDPRTGLGAIWCPPNPADVLKAGDEVGLDLRRMNQEHSGARRHIARLVKRLGLGGKTEEKPDFEKLEALAKKSDGRIPAPDLKASRRHVRGLG